MKRKPYVGLDGHCSFTELAVVTESGRLGKRQRWGTTIPELTAVLGTVPRPRCRNDSGSAGLPPVP